MTEDGFVLTSTSDTEDYEDITWFGFPGGRGYDYGIERCVPMFMSAGATSFDMSNNSTVTIVAKSSVKGAVLEFYLGTGTWAPSSSTYDTGEIDGENTIIFSHMFVSEREYEIFTINYDWFEGGGIKKLIFHFFYKL